MISVYYVGCIIMRYLFVLVFLLFSTSSFLFAWDKFDCSKNRDGFTVLNCKKDEDCSHKKVLYDVDIFCAMKEVFGISSNNVYDDTEEVPVGINQSYILWMYMGGNSDEIMYYEHSDEGFKKKVSFYCANTMKLDREDDKCWHSIYKIDGKEVEFNESLKGKDPVYDWVMKHMPKNRPKAKYIDFGPDLVVDSQLTIY